MNKNCKKFSVNIEFICFPKVLIKELKKLFNKYHISINRIICGKYVNSFNSGRSDFNIYDKYLGSSCVDNSHEKWH